MIGVQSEVEYLRDTARQLKNKIYMEHVPGGADGIAALVLRQASAFITSAASLAEEYEAKRIMENEKSG